MFSNYRHRGNSRKWLDMRISANKAEKYSYAFSDNQEFSYSYHYNNTGQLDTVVYPFGFAIKHIYDIDGRLRTINRIDDDPGLIYQVCYYTKWNTPQLWQSGNHVLTALSYNEAGLLTTKIVGKGVSSYLNLKNNSIQYHQYDYDNAGCINWIGRNHFPYNQSNVANACQKKERFIYDDI
jgi:hypothetical protein